MGPRKKLKKLLKELGVEMAALFIGEHVESDEVAANLRSAPKRKAFAELSEIPADDEQRLVEGLRAQIRIVKKQRGGKVPMQTEPIKARKRA